MDTGRGDSSEAPGEPSPRWGPQDPRAAPRGRQARGRGQERQRRPRGRGGRSPVAGGTDPGPPGTQAGEGPVASWHGALLYAYKCLIPHQGSVSSKPSSSSAGLRPPPVFTSLGRCHVATTLRALPSARGRSVQWRPYSAALLAANVPPAGARPQASGRRPRHTLGGLLAGGWGGPGAKSPWI